jgi:hypothetical protein
MHIHRSRSQPNRANPSWEERWGQADQGLILCWEIGRERAEQHPQLSARATAGELIPLSWKGGVEKPIKPNHKYGSLFYLAMWQGLRGEDLDIDTGRDIEVTCTKNRTVVTFTGNHSLLG